MPSPQGAATKLAKTLRSKFQPKERIATAVVTAVQRDSAGRATGATASVDGLVAQRLYIDIGASIQVGDVFEVVNRGGASSPAWYTMRRLSTTIAVPELPFGTTLPAPTALSLTTGSYLLASGMAGLAWIYATFNTIDPVYGPVGYECECRANTAPDDDDPIVMTRLDPRLFTTLAKSVSSGDLQIPRAPTDADFDFARSGIIQIDSELIAYTYATRRTGIWIWPSSVQDSSLGLFDHVEDQFTDTDTTNITAHTPDYDRTAGGWYVIPTYSSNWAISGNKVVATPGGTWPYSAAIIDSDSMVYSAPRLRGDWIWPSSGQFGYIVDYEDASNFVYVRYDMTNEQFEVVERIAGVESTVWSQADDTLTAAQTYTFEVNATQKTIHIRISGGDLTEDIEYEATDVLTTTMGFASCGIWSDVSVTLDAFYIDDARERDIVDHEWANYIYCERTVNAWVWISDNAEGLNGHYFTIVSGPPTQSGGTIHPAFSGCTRGYGGTTAAAHTLGAGIYAQSLGFMIIGLAGGTDYNVRVRAVLSATVVSPWTDWSTIESAEDAVAPDDPTGFSAISGVGRIEFAWSGPTQEDVADLRGFEIYKATDSSGTGATLFAETGAVTSHSVEVASGTYGYFNIKAVDYSNNKSDYGEATWILAASGHESGGQILTNADFEVVDGTMPVHWQTWAGTQGSYPTLTYETTGGFGGGRCFKAVLSTSVPAASARDRTWAKLVDNIDIPGVEDALYRCSVIVKPSGGLTMDSLLANNYFYFQIASSDGSNFSAITQPLVAEGYNYIGDGWYRFWQDRLWLNSLPSSYPYLALAMTWYQAAGSHSAGQFLVDRVQLELGPNMTAWALVGGATPDGTAIRLDPSGIVSGGIVIDVNGEIASDLEPAADDTYWLGKDNNWQGVNLEDGITAPTGVTGDAKIFVDTSDSLLKVRHGTGTPVSLESQGGCSGTQASNTSDTTVTSWTTLASMSVTVPTGWRIKFDCTVRFYLTTPYGASLCECRIYDGVNAAYGGTSIGNATYGQAATTWISTRTGTYTVYLQANRNDGSATLTVHAYMGRLNYIMWPQV